MIEPPEGHEGKPHKVGKHYYMMMAEITGKPLLHDDYAVLANWMITKISVDNGNMER
jgi:hypothetical protein